MADNTREIAALARGLEQARRETAKLTEALARSALTAQTKGASGCSDGSCSANRSRESTGALSRGISSGLAAAVRNAITGDLSKTLRSLAASIARSFASSVGRSAGGGLAGSLLSTVVGGGLSLLAGKLFPKRQRVQVDNTVRAEVLNFPRFSSLDFAANPASRLFGGRAVARGAGFTVEVAYRDGAEDVVAAKVASKLSDLNSFQGVV
jgi:hypothetical protein